MQEEAASPWDSECTALVMRRLGNVAMHSRSASALPKPLQSRPEWDCWGDSLFEEVGWIGFGFRALGASIVHM